MRNVVHILAAAVLILFSSACEEDVTAITGTNLPYSIYGVLSPQFDSQWVRIYPIEDVLQEQTDEPLDAVVTSRDVTSGEVRTWSDSVITDTDGQRVHVFYAPFAAQYGHRYELDVVRSDGLSSHSATTVPVQTGIVIEERGPQRPVTVPVLVANDVPRIMNVVVRYFVKFGSSPNAADVQQVFDFDYTESARKEGENWRVSINLTEDWKLMAQMLDAANRFDPLYGIALLSMTVRLSVVNEEWNPPGGIFDPDVLVQPGMMDNVDNGFGFLGAGYTLQTSFLPAEEIWAAAGFKPVR